MTGAPAVSRVAARKKWDDEEDEDDVDISLFPGICLTLR